MGRRRPWLAALAGVVAALTGVALLGAAPPSADAAVQPLPERLTHLGDAGQVVVVTTPSWTSSHARLQTWRKTVAGRWVRVLDPVPARVGWNGVRPAENRVQSSGTTPAGTFALPRAFGLADPGGVTLPYRQVDGNDWWPYDPNDPKTYNVLQPYRAKNAHWRTTWAERLSSYRKQYRYSVILDYNLPSDLVWRNGQRIARTTADTSAGGGIFLHVNGSGATAGCVSIARRHMLRVLRWLDPTRAPVVVIGPREVIDQM